MRMHKKSPNRVGVARRADADRLQVFLVQAARMPSKCSFSRNRFHSGVLSKSECGVCTSHPPVMNANTQCSPERSMLAASALNTWCTRKSRHTLSMA